MVLARSVIAQDIADGALADLVDQDIEVRVHTGDPSMGGTASPAAGLSPIVLGPADWTAPNDDEFTAEYGGRFVATTVDINFGTASASETATWLSIWHESDAGLAPGVFDTWRMNIRLDQDLPYVTSDPVIMPAGTIALFATGGYVSEIEGVV